MIIKDRLFLTTNRRRVVAEGHREAAFLFAAPGDEIPDEAAKKYGIEDGGLKGRKGTEDKSKEPDGDKTAAEKEAAEKEAAEKEAAGKAAADTGKKD